MSRSGRFVLAPGARRDVVEIIRDSGRRFGPLQQERYAVLLRAAIDRVAQDPQCIGSQACDEILAGLRSFHIGHAARRRAAASHVLFYEERANDDGSAYVVILRVLHHHMDPDLNIPD